MLSWKAVRVRYSIDGGLLMHAVLVISALLLYCSFIMVSTKHVTTVLFSSTMKLKHAAIGFTEA